MGRKRSVIYIEFTERQVDYVLYFSPLYKTDNYMTRNINPHFKIVENLSKANRHF